MFERFRGVRDPGACAPVSDTQMRAVLATNLTSWVIVSIAVIIFAIIVFAIVPTAIDKDGKLSFLEVKDRLQILQLLVTALLPLFGTWVGTVLAHYYSREAYQTAADAARLQSQGGVSTLRVFDRMVPLAKLKFASLDANQELGALPAGKIQAVFDQKLDSGQNVPRAPVLDAGGRFKAIIHDTTWLEMRERYRAKEKEAERDGDIKPDLPLSELLKLDRQPSKETFEAYVQRTIAYVGVGDLLATAVARKRAVAECDDLAVTSSGTEGNPVVGWLGQDELRAAAAET